MIPFGKSQLKPFIKSSRAIIVTGSLLVVATLGALMWGRLTGPPGAWDHPVLAQVPLPNDGGVPVQRARIDNYITRVSTEQSFEKLAAGLDKHEDILVAVAMWSQEPHPEMMFETCLANRRLARLFEILRQRKDADRLCRSLFESKLTALREGYVRIVETWERGITRIQQARPDLTVADADLGSGSRESSRLQKQIWQLGDPPKKFWDGYSSECALSGAVFLAAEFSSVEEVLRELDAWTALGDGLAVRCDALEGWLPEGARIGITRGTYPQSRFQLNLLASMLYRRFHIDPGGTWESDQEGMEAIRAPQQRSPIFDPEGEIPYWIVYRKVPLCRWDAATNPFDFTHIARGVPIDDSKTFGNFLVYNGWGILRQVKNGEERILTELRKRLLAAAAAEAAKD